jgi:NnrS protein
MNHYQPQAAGLPSGSFGARRGAPSRARPLHRLLAAPQRLAFAAGGVLLVASALWWALAQLAPALGLPLPWVLDPALAQAWLLGAAVWPLFLVGLLCDALPRWLDGPPLAARLLVLPMALVVGGATVAALGAHGSTTLAALGLAVVAVGLALLTGLVGLTVLEHRSAPGDAAGRAHALPAVWGLAVLALGTWAGAVALALGQGLWLQMALQAVLWLGLVPLAVALGRPHGAGMAPSSTRQGALQRFAWVWLGTAAGLTLMRPELPVWPALLMGCMGNLVMLRATEVALQQAGRRPRIDNAVWFSAWAAQVAVLAAMLAPLQAGGGGAGELLAAQFWLAAVVHWAWHLQPSLLRLPGGAR